MFYRAIIIIIMGYGYAKVAKIPLHYKSPAVNKTLLGQPCLGVLTMFFVFYGFQRADLSEAIALFQIVPVVSAILGVLILKETFSAMQGIVTLVSIAGALMILKPAFLYESLEDDDDTEKDSTKFIGNLSVLVSAILCALSIVLTRKIAVQKIDPQVLSCYFGPILCMVVTIGMMMQGMKGIEKDEVISIAIICFLGYISNFFNMRAVKYADAGKIAIMAYAEIPFGYIMDTVFFDVQLDEWSSFGVLLIFSCLLIHVFQAQIIDFMKRKGRKKEQSESESM